MEISWKLCDKLCKVRGLKSPDMENTMPIDETEIKVLLVNFENILWHILVVIYDFFNRIQF